MVFPNRFGFPDGVWKVRVGRSCLLCGTQFYHEGEMVLCDRLNCKGCYCKDCFAMLRQQCTLCLEPEEYGDLSEISQEKWVFAITLSKLY
jgi:hypothetical protein